MTFDVTLTFDNGPEPEVMPHILITLNRCELLSTFFVLGHKLLLPGRRELVQRAVGEGHWVGNHTFTHSVPLGLCTGLDVAEAEIGRTQALLADLSDGRRLFRPFGDEGQIGPHLLSETTLKFLKAGRYTLVLWNVVPRDWERPQDWPEHALVECRQRPWSLVVLHDLPTGAMGQLERFIGLVRNEGGRFRQAFPPDCVPLQSGRQVLPIAHLVSR
jgi:peptidoglycan-N-acetylglucosamine deacetylase